jgi:hypothetical protein
LHFSGAAHKRIGKQKGKLLRRVLNRYRFEIKLQLSIVSPVDERYHLRQRQSTNTAVTTTGRCRTLPQCTSHELRYTFLQVSSLWGSS